MAIQEEMTSKHYRMMEGLSDFNALGNMAQEVEKVYQSLMEEGFTEDQVTGFLHFQINDMTTHLSKSNG